MICPTYFTIPGSPVAKGRPRFRAIKKFVSTYTPKKTLLAEKNIRECFKQQHPEWEKPLNTPISLTVKFLMPIPTSLSKKKQAALKLSPHTKKPDMDNLAKTVCDALNGVVWEDDSQVYMIKAIKAYACEEPCTLVEINEVPGE